MHILNHQHPKVKNGSLRVEQKNGSLVVEPTVSRFTAAEPPPGSGWRIGLGLEAVIVTWRTEDSDARDVSFASLCEISSLFVQPVAKEKPDMKLQRRIRSLLRIDVFHSAC